MHTTIDELISHEVFLKSFCKSQFHDARARDDHLVLRPLASFLHHTHTTIDEHAYRGTSLIRNRPTLALYNRLMSRALWWT